MLTVWFFVPISTTGISSINRRLLKPYTQKVITSWIAWLDKDFKPQQNHQSTEWMNDEDMRLQRPAPQHSAKFNAHFARGAALAVSHPKTTGKSCFQLELDSVPGVRPS